MSLFKKNPNEVAYVGGEKHWCDVIKNSGPGGLLMWCQPEEDFNTNSTLIVGLGEMAVFVKGGNVEQVFENGTYQLSTENYPFISRLRNAFTGGISTFNCKVIFFRKAHSKELLWGTDSPIQVRDKVWGVRTDARARGAYKVKIENPVILVEKLIGNNIPFQCQEDLFQYFASEFQGKIKTAVSKLLNGLEQELIGVDAYLDELSEKIEPSIDEILSEYGLKCVNFNLSGLDIDTTKYDVIDESQMELIAKDRLERGKELEFRTAKTGLDVLGNDWERVQRVDILKDLANNPGSGGLAATGAGIGMGLGAVGAFTPMTQDLFSESSNSQPMTVEEPMETLAKLKKLLEAGLIEQAEYDAKKAEVLSRM